MTATSIYIDRRHPTKPYTVTLRGGATGLLVEHHRFGNESQAIAFYEANR